MTEDKLIKLGIKYSKFLIVGIVLLILGRQSMYTVEPGCASILIRMGGIKAYNDVPGIYFKIPFIDKAVIFNKRVQMAEVHAEALSKDMQSIHVCVALNFKLENAMELYTNVGNNIGETIIFPFAQESIKAAIAQYTAEDLIHNRQHVKDEVASTLARRLTPFNITMVDLNFVGFEFSKDFIKAVEKKQIAEQRAKKAKNLTKKVQEEAEQSKARTDAEVYALHQKREAVTEELIQLKKAEAFIKAIDKWDGHMPRTISNAIPFLDIDKQ